MNLFAPSRFFDLEDSPAAPLFRTVEYVWEAVPKLPGFIEDIIEPKLLGEIEEGAWVEPGKVQLEEGSLIERGAIVRGPTIIGRDTVVRSAAYIRGHVMTGEGCLIGHATELRQVLMLNGASVPHFNGVFTSLLGNRAWMAGVSSSANFLLSKKEIDVRVEIDGKQMVFPTGLTHLGIVVGDDSTIGAYVLLQPATLVGRNCQIYSQATWSGYIPDNMVIRPKEAQFEMVPRKA